MCVAWKKNILTWNSGECILSDVGCTESTIRGLSVHNSSCYAIRERVAAQSQSEAFIRGCQTWDVPIQSFVDYVRRHAHRKLSFVGVRRGMFRFNHSWTMCVGTQYQVNVCGLGYLRRTAIFFVDYVRRQAVGSGSSCVDSGTCGGPPLFKLSSKYQAGILVGLATLQETYGSVLMVGENSYVVAKEHVAYVQDHFPLQHQKSRNKELEFLHRLLGRGGSGLLTVDTSSQDHAAFDPSHTDPPTAPVAGDDSDGLESDEEVKAIVGQLDESVSQLSSYNPFLFPREEDMGLETDVEKGEQVLQSKPGTLTEGSALPLSQEGYHSTSVNSSVEDVPEVTRRSKRRKVQSGRQLNTAEFRARPVVLDDVTARPQTIDKLSIKKFKANKTFLIGRKIKRNFNRDFLRC